MIALRSQVLHEVDELYRTRDARLEDFSEVLKRFRNPVDTELAEIIEADGRARVRLGLAVELQRYLDGVPGLARRPEALDAAIDMALRGRRGDERAVDELVRLHPDLAGAIRETAALNNAMWSTASFRRRLLGPAVRDLPCSFGPPLDDGLPRYELREVLGAGSFGTVYLAADRLLSEPDRPALVSLKVLPGERRSSWTRRQLVEEATKARRIEHPNVARVLDRGVAGDDEDYIVYEFLDGGDLGRWVRRRSGALGVAEAVRMTAQIARGVHAAHMAGLVHCDLNPSNVVLTSAGAPKVIDFGIAIRLEDQEQRDREDAAPVGNLAFMSPEQFRMEPGALTIPADVYALGGILYWLLTGRLPNGTTPDEIRLTHEGPGARPGPPAPRHHRPGIDRDLQAICGRAMATLPADRFGSAGEMAESLEAWLRREPIPWTRPSALRRAGLWVRRQPALAAVLLAAILVGAGSGAGLWHLGAVAGEREDELEISQGRRMQAGEAARNVMAVIEKYKDELPEQALAEIWVLEWLLGPTVLGEGEDRFGLWDMRVAVLRDLVARAAVRGAERDFHTMLWETALAFWLLEGGEIGEAAEVLDRAIPKWTAILDPSDPWLGCLDAMKVCAGAARAERDPSSVTAPEREALGAALERAERLLAAHAPWSPLHLLVRNTMMDFDSIGEPETAAAAGDE